jgi:hypothetical protein
LVTSVLVLVAFVLVLVATVLLVLAFLSDSGIGLVYASILCSLVAGVLVYLSHRMTRQVAPVLGRRTDSIRVADALPVTGGGAVLAESAVEPSDAIEKVVVQPALPEEPVQPVQPMQPVSPEETWVVAEHDLDAAVAEMIGGEPEPELEAEEAVELEAEVAEPSPFAPPVVEEAPAPVAKEAPPAKKAAAKKAPVAKKAAPAKKAAAKKAPVAKKATPVKKAAATKKAPVAKKAAPAKKATATKKAAAPVKKATKATKAVKKQP